MIKSLFNLLHVLLFTGLLYAQPTDNPYTSFYGPKPGHFTDSIRWGNTVNIQDFQGASIHERLERAQDAVIAMGGGVIFFPAGDYTFTDEVVLRSGVVVRGETPIVTQAKNDGFAPPTRWHFPAYVPSFTGDGTPNSTAFKRISTVAHAENVGLVYLDINRAAIRLRSQTWVTVNTPKGPTQRSLENNGNFIVFGVRNNNVASPEVGVPDTGQLGWQRFCSRFTVNISIYCNRNAVVSNCRVNDFTNNIARPVADDSYEQPGYLAFRSSSNSYEPVDEGAMARFDYSDHYGIGVNRKSMVTFAEPEDEPGAFRPGLEINDNWVYKTMRVGIYACGLGLEINRNKLLDKPGKVVYLHPNGQRFQTNNSATYENRGIDWSGWNVTVDGNEIDVYRHRINSPTGYPSVDGEGILIQECCGGTSVNGAVITNNLTRNYIGVYKMRDVYDVIIKNNQLFNNSIQVTANTNGADYTINNVLIDSNTAVSGILVNGTRGGTPCFVRRNTGSGNLNRPCHVVEQNNAGFNVNMCTQVPARQFPMAEFVPSTFDTLIYFPAAPLVLPVQISNGSPIRIELWEGTTKVGDVDFQAMQAAWPIPYRNQDFFLKLRAIDQDSNRVWGNTVKVRVRDRVLTGAQAKLDDRQFSLFPNPAKVCANLRNNSPVAAKVFVWEITGKLRYESSIAAHATLSIPMNDWQAGIKFVVIQTDSGRQCLKLLAE